ncbi:MAG: sensor histidine kinase [Ktedonobacteraceae bacterium]|nr:sensor histidine kinase [Ktedonobacteraceae bacterium]
MRNIVSYLRNWVQRWRLSLFEKVILVNSLMLVGEAIVGLWVTRHSIEVHHYLIDTGFIILATIFTLFINIILLRASFRPLFHLLTIIRMVSSGNTRARATITDPTLEVGELAQAFNSMLDRLEEVRREQTMLILQAQEDERRRIGLELHDETGQNLTALLVHTELLHQKLLILPETDVSLQARQQMTADLRQLNRLAQQILENIRVLAQQLRPSVLDDLGLLAAFRWLVEDSEQRLHLPTELKVEGLEKTSHPLPPPIETALFRIAQESLTNIARYAHAQHVWITLTRDQQCVTLQIRDDGCGFDTARRTTTLGIPGMCQRAESLNGTLTIHSQPEQGTTVQAQIPLPATPVSETTEPIKETSYVRR